MRKFRLHSFFSSKPPISTARSASGFTLIEMVVGLAVGLIGILIFSSGILATLSSADAVKSTAARDEMNFMIRRTILDRQALKVTIEKNPVVKAVVEGTYQSPFEVVYSNTDYGITLYDSSGMAVSGPDADFINPTATPLHYTRDGFPCSGPLRPQCTISVKTSFMIQSIPKYKKGVTNNLAPSPQQPLWYKSIKPDFMQINYVIESKEKDSQGKEIKRSPVEGSIFIDFEDLGN